VSSHDGRSRTAFVFAGGGSLGAIHVGMLHSLASRGITADMVVGSSVGALNGAYYAGNPTREGIQRLDAIWRGLRRNDVFPLSWRTIAAFLYRRDFLVGSDALRQLVDDNLGYRNLQDARLPVNELQSLDHSIDYFVVPPLCPLTGSPYDFSRTSELIERAAASTDAWLAEGGLNHSRIHAQLSTHKHVHQRAGRDEAMNTKPLQRHLDTS
jgi:predicted acylesterase/phospholipase RssA